MENSDGQLRYSRKTTGVAFAVPGLIKIQKEVYAHIIKKLATKNKL